MHHNRILAVQGERPLQDDVLIALERAATVVALDATKKLAVTAVERKFRSDFLYELLSGRARNEREVLSRSRLLGWDLERPLIVVVAELEPTLDGERLELGARLRRGGGVAGRGDRDPAGAALPPSPLVWREPSGRHVDRARGSLRAGDQGVADRPAHPRPRRRHPVRQPGRVPAAQPDRRHRRAALLRVREPRAVAGAGPPRAGRPAPDPRGAGGVQPQRR